MLGISFRIFCGLCDSEVDFRSIGVILVVLGWLLGCIFGSLELPLERLGRHLGVILEVLGCCGGPFWGSGGASGRLRRAMALKDPWSHLASHHFNRFWWPKRAQKAAEMELQRSCVEQSETSK